MKILHLHVNRERDPAFVGKALEVMNTSIKPRVYIAGRVYEQRLVGRILDRRKSGLVGRFPLLPEPVIVAGTKRPRQMLKEHVSKGMFLS